MGDAPGKNFTSGLLSVGIFKCAVCKNILKLPAMLVEDLGNICCFCFEGKTACEELNALPNEDLGSIMKSLIFPCNFASRGCTVEIKYDELDKHHKHCFFRAVQCMMPKEECEWEGSLTELNSHFSDEHPRHVVKSPHDIFSFNVNVSQCDNYIKLLMNKNKTYLVEIIRVDEDENLMHFIRGINNICTNNISEMLAMTIKYIGKDSQYKSKLMCLPLQHEGGGTKISLSTLKRIAETNGNITVTIKPSKSITENTINGQLHKYLECLICQDLMRPPIHQCTVGHSVCKACRPKLASCPTCRQGWSNVRNFGLENVTPSIIYPCAYNTLGCDATCLGSEIDKHEVSCIFKSYTCPIATCEYKGNFSASKNHFKHKHVENFIEPNIYSSTFVQNHSGTAVVVKKYFFEHNNIYELTVTRSNISCTFIVKILNSYDCSLNKYFYVITINHPNVDQRKLIKSNLCFNVDAEISANDEIRFTYDELAAYKDATNNEMITFFCKIDQIN